MGHFSIWGTFLIFVLSLAFVRFVTSENNERISKFLLMSPKERMELIRAAIMNYGPVNQNHFGEDDSDEFFDSSPYGPDPELNPNLPYNIQNVRSVGEPKGNQRRDVNDKQPHFQPLCETYRRSVKLDNMFYEYRPNHYDEVYCVYPYVADQNVDNNVCNEGGFHCIQLNRTIFVTKREKGSSCWEVEHRRVASGCECMWPKHYRGDIQFFQ
ncbi:uncharacterized protein LOC134831951 [Culicoides brevitarsis]|uniref:uncharacterized protein LOC134831951 n=1 Tax=Culicoides brevitarsis TaxID=469753 RepID=UPI00307BD1C9